MGAVLKKEDADKIVFNVQPRSINLEPSKTAKEFVSQQLLNGSEFHIADVISSQSGIKDLQKKNVDAQIEEIVLERLKAVQELAYQKAYELGLEEGRQLALAETKENVLNHLQAFDKFMLNVDGLTVRLSEESESLLVRLTYLVAEKIAMRSIEMDQAPIIDLIKSVVSEVQSAHQIRILLNPSDAQFIEQMRQHAGKEIEILNRVKIEHSDEVAVGGCVMTTEFGEVDASIAQRVEKAWQILAAKLPAINGDNKP